MGTKPIALPDGEQRTSIQDGDTVGMTAVCARDDRPWKVGFGDCNGRVVPAV